MARYRKRQRLDSRTRNQLLADFAQALTVIQSPAEGAKVIQDLFTEPEAEMLAKRLAIADRLIDGARYEDIQKELRVSPPTIARVNAWLYESGEGFRMVRNRKRKIPMTVAPKRRYPPRFSQYFWPAYFIQELLEQANDRQRKQLETAFAKLGKKSALYKDLEPVFRKFSV